MVTNNDDRRSDGLLSPDPIKALYSVYPHMNIILVWAYGLSISFYTSLTCVTLILSILSPLEVSTLLSHTGFLFLRIYRVLKYELDLFIVWTHQHQYCRLMGSQLNSFQVLKSSVSEVNLMLHERGNFSEASRFKTKHNITISGKLNTP